MFISIRKDVFNGVKETKFFFAHLRGFISTPPEGIEFSTTIDFFIEGNERFCVTFRFDKSSVSLSELRKIIYEDKIISLKFVDLCQQYRSEKGDIYIPILCELIRLEETEEMDDFFLKFDSRKNLL